MMQRYDIHPVLNRFQDQMNRFLEDAYQDSQDTTSATAEWSPQVDILEFTDRFELYADMPGINTDSIELSLENNVLTISGERTKLSTDNNSVQPRARLERSMGIFHRQFVLPNVADTDDITASSKDGVLQVIIRKKAEAKTRKIEVLNMH
ncbi:MAG: Hsp20/alpha crystallin family protein [Pseudomonadota bacterium]